MGIFDGLMGNASQVNAEGLQKEMQQLLVNGERIQSAYKVIRDIFIFTNKRLIVVDKQGVTGKKTEYLSFPYKSIAHFSVETAGTFDLDAELKIWISGSTVPIQKNFNKTANIYDVQRVLAQFVLD